jgi:hypothetical protein
LATAEAQRGFFQWGVHQFFFNYDQAIPALALGVALARLRPILAASTCALFTATFCAGLIARSALLPIIGSLSLIASGAMLTVPESLRLWMTPVLAVPLGLSIGMTISFDAPQDANWVAYIVGGAQTGSWLIALAALLWPMLPAAASRIAMPILGSWLIAIGLLLAGATLAERPVASGSADVLAE